VVAASTGGVAALERAGDAFFERHQLAAAERLEALVERSRLAPRLTMSYDPASVGRSRGVNHALHTSDSAAEARRKLNALALEMPADCWNVAFDVCGLGKGLQAIESERRWPRRSAKLVLRIALEQLATSFGLAPHRAGSEARPASWLEERLPLIARDDDALS
jgi:hypothetical protein